MSDFDQSQREILAGGGHRNTDLGEVLRFENEAHRQRITRNYGLDHPDFDQRQINIALFHKSADYQRVRTYAKRYF